MALVSLTVDGSSFSLDENDIVKVYELSSEVKVEYLLVKLGITKTIAVSESVSAIGGLSNVLISLTNSESGDTFLLNSSKISETFTEGSGAKVNYDVAGVLNSIIVDETTSEVKDLFPTTSTAPVKVWRGFISQSGVGIPTATVFENSLGGDITWSRVSPGIYRGTYPSVTAGKNIVIITPTDNTNPEHQIFAQGTDADYVQIQTYDDTLGYNAVDNLLINNSLTIYIYE